MNKKFLGSAVALALTAGVSSNANATLASDAVLNFDDGIGACQAGGTYPTCTFGATTTAGGSYFVMDTNGDGTLAQEERVIIANAANGITLGSAQARGEVDLVWSFGGNPGEHYTSDADGLTIASASGATASIDMSGWTVWWGDVAAGEDGPIDMGAGANATLTCAVDCAVGDTFTLDYQAIVPSGGFSGFGYGLHLEGVVAAVPVPAAVWLFGSGLIGLAGVARRRKAA
ncbi:MAG: VPLPA-CTERM sorting domain-containing protein [Gammaproteobacteria bacterium]|nr:VPLPA-CTERM sorting domain-containing protein [Gammaproteobacteria bacterium]